MSNEIDTHPGWPVLIAGAGPVGMLLANFLGRRGIRCLLIEKRAGRVDWSRAIGITPPSLDILCLADLHQRTISSGVKVRKAVVHDDSGRAGVLGFKKIQSRFRFILTLPQAKTMEILEEALERSPDVTVRRGTELTGLDMEQESVNVRMKNTGSGREEAIATRWLVGADGADSTVRSLAGIPFVRKSYGLSFVMADYDDTTGWGDEAHLFFTRRGSLESFPLPDARRRWIALMDEAPDVGDKGEWLESRTAQLSGKNLAGCRCSPIFQFEPEKIRPARLWCKRVILAGDAAHVMSPIGGQGMNTGFADAEFLASVLPELLECDCSREYREKLNEYDFCRRRAALSARRRAALGMWVGTRTGTMASALRGTLLRRVLLKHPVKDKLAPHFAMLNIPYNRLNRPAAGLTS